MIKKSALLLSVVPLLLSSMTTFAAPQLSGKPIDLIFSTPANASSYATYTNFSVSPGKDGQVFSTVDSSTKVQLSQQSPDNTGNKIAISYFNPSNPKVTQGYSDNLFLYFDRTIDGQTSRINCILRFKDNVMVNYNTHLPLQSGDSACWGGTGLKETTVKFFQHGDYQLVIQSNGTH